MAAAKKSMKFEDAVKELEQVVKKLESDDISLDESIKLYEYGKSLSSYCLKKLNDAEGKVTVIQKLNSTIEEKEFAAKEDD